MPPREQWQLSGSAAELDERYPAQYILGPWAPGLVALAHIQLGERVLDLACGTGVVARLAAPAVGLTGRVTGVDLNPGMLAVARSLPAPSGPPITWMEGSARGESGCGRRLRSTCCPGRSGQPRVASLPGW